MDPQSTGVLALAGGLLSPGSFGQGLTAGINKPAGRGPQSSEDRAGQATDADGATEVRAGHRAIQLAVAHHG